MCFLLVFLVYLTFGNGADSKTQNCNDLMGRPGMCINLSACPFLLEEFYETARRFPERVDFQSFVSQAICGFDGFRFLICCTIRPKNVEYQQASQANPLNSQLSSTLLQFASLGNSPSPVIPQPIPTSMPPSQNVPQTTTQRTAQASQLPPLIIAPVPSQATELPPLIIAPVPSQANTELPPLIIAPFPSQQPAPSPTLKLPQDLIEINPLPYDTSPASNPFTLPPPVKSISSKNEQCGITNAYTNRVVGGLETKKGAYPWMAALGFYEPAEPTVLKFFCSGSLVSSTYVITAAHCINPSLSTVRLGAHDLSKTEATAIDVKIKRNVVHEKFDPKTISNDIALLQLNDAVSFTEFIRPICLPEDIKFMQQDFVGNNPFIAGWGSVQFQGASSNVLRDAQVPIIETKTCMDNYSAVFKVTDVTETLICAGSYMMDACQGDSGGPLMMPQKSEDNIFQYYLLGLVSYGYECARAGYPGVYTRVAAYVPWIKNNMT